MAEQEKTQKQRARDFLNRPRPARTGPPSQEEIRRQMGWDLAEQARIERERQKLRKP